MLLSKEGILAAKDLKTEDVFIEEWGGDVRIMTMRAVDRDRFEQSIIDQRGKEQVKNMENFRAKLIANTAIDEEGKLLFTMDDVKAIGRKSAKAIDKLVDVAQRLNGMRKEDVEELTKNSEAGQSEDSISA
jgi:hypothetical protein